MSAPKPKSVPKVQPELLLPGESPLPSCGELTARDRADEVSAALQACPSLAALSEEQRRWAVVWALSDRRRLGMAELAAIAGVGERSAYRYQASASVRSAEAEIVATLTPPGFAALREAGEEVAGRLASDLRFGRVTLDSLGAGERYLLDLAYGASRDSQGSTRTTIRLGGSHDSAEVTVEHSDGLDEARKELRERLLGRGGGACVGGGCQSLPGAGGDVADGEGEA